MPNQLFTEILSSVVFFCAFISFYYFFHYCRRYHFGGVAALTKSCQTCLTPWWFRPLLRWFPLRNRSTRLSRPRHRCSRSRWFSLGTTNKQVRDDDTTWPHSHAEIVHANAPAELTPHMWSVMRTGTEQETKKSSFTARRAEWASFVEGRAIVVLYGCLMACRASYSYACRLVEEKTFYFQK